MRKVWLIASREYLTNIRRPAFLFATFGVPIITVAAMVLITLLITRETPLDVPVVGIVDLADVLSVDAPEDLVLYADRDRAEAALEAGNIGAYVILPESYLESGDTPLFGADDLPDDLWDALEAYLIENLTSQIEVDVPRERLIDPMDNASIVLVDTGRELTLSAAVVLLITPFLLVTLLIMAVSVTSSYLMATVVEEKTNRMIEVLTTSVRPVELLAGKIFGLGALGLTQILIYVTGPALVFGLLNRSSVDFELALPVDLLVLSVVYFLLSYFMIGSIMAAIGVLVDGEQESRQYASIFTLLYIIPAMFSVLFLLDPNGIVPVTLSLIPFTSPLAMLMRMGYTSVPTWQIVTSMGLLSLTMLFALWAAARIFRWSTLLYGQSFSLRLLRRVLARAPQRGDLAVERRTVS